MQHTKTSKTISMIISYYIITKLNWGTAEKHVFEVIQSQMLAICFDALFLVRELWPTLYDTRTAGVKMNSLYSFKICCISFTSFVNFVFLEVYCSTSGVENHWSKKFINLSKSI